MIGVLIAVTVITGWWWVMLRLHASWTPPPEPLTIRLSVAAERYSAAMRRVVEAFRAFGVSAVEAGENMRRAVEAMPTVGGKGARR